MLSKYIQTASWLVGLATLCVRPAFFLRSELRNTCIVHFRFYRCSCDTSVTEIENDNTMEVAKDISNGTVPDVYAMDDGFTDVDTDVAASGKDVGASLPSVEEVRNTVHMRRGSKSGMSFNAIMAMTVVACVIIAASLGLGLGVSNKNNAARSDQSSFEGSFDNTERKSDSEDVINYLVLAGVSSEVSLRTLDTPQNTALTWLALDDEANTAVPDVPITEVEGYRYMTRYVLAVVYFSMGGENWNFQAGFTTIKDVCSWNQVKFDGSSFYRQGVLCDSKTGLIFALDLDSNNLVGTIPPEIGALNTLQLFSMTTNSIVGGIPTQICQLYQLETFELSFNGLAGRLPACIAELKSLEMLFLSDNLMTGPLPATIGTLSKLKGLIVDDNAFSGEVANLFNNLPDLMWLHLEDNDFYGTITDNFLANQSELLQIDLSGNNFLGTLPPHLLTMPKLQILDVHSNRLDGKIPAVLALNKNLIFLSMHDNSITGALPNTFENLQVLLHLDVSSNQLTGGFPVEYGLMSSLEYFFASGNDFAEDIIPSFLESLPNLREIGLKSANRTGTIPLWLGSLKNLTLLDFDDNKLFGPLPAELGLLTKLQFLLLNRNSLTGGIPVEYDKLTSLRMAFFDKNKLNGTLAPLCRLPTFSMPRTDLAGRELLAADCASGFGALAAEIKCTCCTSCCVDGDSNCNNNYEIPNLDPTWEASYNRVFFKFGDKTSSFATSDP